MNWGPLYQKDIIFEKVSQRRKKLKRGPFGIFPLPFCRKTPRKIEKKSRNAEKTLKEGGTLWCRPVLQVMRETFLVQFLGPTGTIWRLLKIL